MFEVGVFDSDPINAGSGLVDRRVNPRINYSSELSESEFVYRFRLDKTRVNHLLLEITQTLRVTSRNFGLSPLHQLLLALRFYALGTMLVSAADFVGVSVPSASRIVRDVSRAIAGLYHQYVRVLENTQNGFYQIATKSNKSLYGCFGVWKRRFPVLLLKIRLALVTAQAVIIATFVLHNICMLHVVEVDLEIDLPSASNNSDSEEGQYNTDNVILNNPTEAKSYNQLYI